MTTHDQHTEQSESSDEAKPVTGGAQFEVEPNKPVDITTWQAQFVKGGTRHGFKNTGTSTTTVIEVFVKK